MFCVFSALTSSIQVLNCRSHGYTWYAGSGKSTIAICGLGAMASNKLNIFPGTSSLIWRFLVESCQTHKGVRHERWWNAVCSSGGTNAIAS